VIVVIDNYDSFVYNLVQLFQKLGEEVLVFRNDRVGIDEVRDLKPSHIVISPGPCTPQTAGISVDLIRALGPAIPVFGVCLGHEAVGEAYGARLARCQKVFHGKTSEVHHDRSGVFSGIDSPMTAGRYHSLVIDPETLPPELEVTAWADDGSIMAVRHRTHPVVGVQFHPESVLTPQGARLCENFLFGGRDRMTLRVAIRTALDGTDLSADQAGDVMGQVLSGSATPAQIASFITALRCKGETAAEVTGFARVMRSFAGTIEVPEGPIIDTCGTGGDGAQTFNISTAAALVAAGAGCRVAKHGNRSVSSKCGSADVLSELGVNITCAREKMEEALRTAGIAFLFAPVFHAAMKHAVGPRREIGVRTVFNMLGPLTNPAGARRQLLGVYDADLCVLFAEVLRDLGSERAMIVHGTDGLDEITLTGATFVATLSDGRIETSEISPADFGLSPCKPADLVGGTARENARIVSDLLAGAEGPARDVVLMNAAASLVMAGLAPDFREGLTLAAESIDTGKAATSLAKLVEITHG